MCSGWVNISYGFGCKDRNPNYGSGSDLYIFVVTGKLCCKKIAVLWIRVRSDPKLLAGSGSPALPRTIHFFAQSAVTLNWPVRFYSTDTIMKNYCACRPQTEFSTMFLTGCSSRRWTRCSTARTSRSYNSAPTASRSWPGNYPEIPRYQCLQYWRL